MIILHTKQGYSWAKQPVAVGASQRQTVAVGPSRPTGPLGPKRITQASRLGGGVAPTGPGMLTRANAPRRWRHDGHPEFRAGRRGVAGGAQLARRAGATGAEGRGKHLRSRVVRSVRDLRWRTVCHSVRMAGGALCGQTAL